MNKYPVSSQLRGAIEVLFNDPSVGLGFLGRGIDFLPLSGKEPSLSPNMSAADRARMLREKLESYVMQMAAEAEELGEEEVPRLRSETTATLVVLRELQRHFPEAFAEESDTQT
jgi:hypothetical protein